MKIRWIAALAILPWSNLREVHAQPIRPDSTSPTQPTPTMAVPLPIMMEIVLAAEQTEMCVVLKFMSFCFVTYVVVVPCRTTQGMDEIMPETVQPEVSTTAQSDEAQHTASPLSIETSSAPIPTMSVTMSMSMRSAQQRRVAIVMGGLAGGIAVLALTSTVAMLCHNALQKRYGKGQGRRRYGVKNHEMDGDDDDDSDIEGEYLVDSKLTMSSFLFFSF